MAGTDGYTLVVDKVTLPALVIHGGAGAYLKTTTAAHRKLRGDTLAHIVTQAHTAFADGTDRALLAAMEALEADPGFNAGYGSRLQQDGVARMSASLMDGALQKMSAVYNVQSCKHPSQLCAALQSRADRNLDGEGAALLMRELGIEQTDVRAERTVARGQKLHARGDKADREAAIGDASEEALELARRAKIAVPTELEKLVSHDDDEHNRYGTVGALVCDSSGALFACTSTGGRGHEAVGRVSDSPTATGNYACPVVALSATGFGEQIIDLNVCGRISTRMIDGASLEQALRTTFDEVVAAGGLLGVIAIARDGSIGYAHSTEACGVAWLDAAGKLHVDRHGRG